MGEDITFLKYALKKALAVKNGEATIWELEGALIKKYGPITFQVCLFLLDVDWMLI